MFQPISTEALSSAAAFDARIAAPLRRAPPPRRAAKKFVADRLVDDADLDLAAL